MFGRLFSGIRYVFDYNSSTLSGALDVIVVQHSDGTLRSTPFHVRFGKLKVFRSKEKLVQLLVNGQPVALAMKLASTGEAFFVEETEEQIAASLTTSPIVGPSESPPSSPKNLEERKMPLEAEIPELVLKKTKEPRPRRSIFGRIAGFFKKTPTEVQEATGGLEPLTQFSLSRAQIEQGGDPVECFGQGLVSWEAFRVDPWAILMHPNLVVKFQGKLMDWNTAAPLIFAQIVYSQSLEIPEELPSEGQISPPAVSPPPEEEPKSQHPQGSSHITYKKTLSLSSASLRLLNLRPGSNEVTFTVRSKLQGAQSLQGKIYLWEEGSKIVVSDIDGTITRSDVLGHLLPKIGKDWSHRGICSLYSKIIENGYQVLYLTARAIGQVGSTKEYLETLKQGDLLLPDGPVFTSPDRLIDSFVREVITKEPHIFKSRVLIQLSELFPKDRYPLYAGFGNRETDEIAYHSAGISPDRTFTINPTGEIVNGHGFKTTYLHLADLVAHMFPPLNTARNLMEDTDYSVLKYWKVPMQHLLPEDLEEPL